MLTSLKLTKLFILIIAIILLVSAQQTAFGQASTEDRAVPTAIFVVNGSGDLPDANLSDGVCDTDLSAGGDQCSLRAAIEQANNSSAADIIRFSNNQRTITPATAYETISEPLTINAIASNSATCPTATTPADLLVTLDGSGSTGSAGLIFGAGSEGSLVRGLSIINFTAGSVGAGISVGADDIVIACNHIGIEADGETAAGNTYGLSLQADNLLIGGSDVSSRNVVSGNDVWGISIGGLSQSAEIYNNYLGSNADGTGAVPNNIAIIGQNGASATIGAQNQGNLIIGNSSHGVDDNGANMEIRYNSFYQNGGLAISGPATNVDLDYIDSAGQVVIDFSDYISTYPATIDIYGNDACDPINGEGKEHFATFDVATATDTIDMALNAGQLNHPFASLLVTSPTGGTFEFNDCIAVTPGFRINDSGDDPDMTPGDNRCDSSTAAGIQCTLRAAFEEVNALDVSTPTTLHFDIALPTTLTPASALPGLGAPITIDLSQVSGVVCPNISSSSSTMALMLNGVNAGTGASGISLQSDADGSTIAGLSIINFDVDGVTASADDLTLRCNHIGVRRIGTSLGSNGRDGVRLVSSSNTLIENNVIAGNSSDGINQTTGSDLTITNNYIGVNADYSITSGNGGDGIRTGASNTTVSFAVVGGNGENGIVVRTNGDLDLTSSYVGTDVTNSLDLGNSLDGVYFFGSGSFSNISDSHIAWNGEVGVSLASTRENVVIVRNSIYDNGSLGIDLNEDGVTANDPVPDADSGANGLQNFPVILAADGPSDSITITLESAASQTFDFHFYANDSCDPSDHGEGQRYLSTFDATTNASGVVTAVFSGVGFAVNDYLSVTATGASDTSEFSACFHAVEAFVVNTTADDGDADSADGRCLTSAGFCSLRAAIEQVNALNEIRTIEFESAGMVFTPQTALPVILKPVVIDGSASAAGSRGLDEPLTVIDGSALASSALLRLGAGSDGSTLHGLQLINMSGDGLAIDSSNNSIDGNAIGTNDVGDDLGNSGHGIVIQGSNNAILGNVIHHSGLDGVAVLSGGIGNTIRLNSIDDNDGIGIDLNNNGNTANDLGDGDSGANGLQNFPLFTELNTNLAEGTLNSVADTDFQIDLYGLESCNVNSTGTGEGRIYLGSTTATTNASGDASWTLTPDASACTPYAAVTATNLATGDTSEISSCVAVVTATPTAVGLASGGATDSLRTTIALVVVMVILAAVAFNLRRRSALLLLPIFAIVLLGVGGISAETTTTITPPLTCDDVFVADGTLNNDSSLEDSSGLIVATVADTLDEPLDIRLETVSAPDPLYDNVGTVVSPYYRVTPSSEIVTPANSPLVLAVPVPDGVDGNNLLIALYNKGAEIPDSGGEDFWSITTTHYDSADGLMLVALHGLSADGQLLTLVESADFEPITSPSRERVTGFTVSCPSGCSVASRAAYALELLDAYNDFVGTHGFNEPALQAYSLSINKDSSNTWVPSIDVGDVFNAIKLRPSVNCFTTDSDGVKHFYAGIYHPVSKELEICPDNVNAAVTDAIRRTTRHELFHAIQHAYPSIHQSPDWHQEWVIEGTASLAAASISGLHRTPNWVVRDVTFPLIKTYQDPEPNNHFLAYEGQDFWYFLLDDSGQPLGYLEQIFQGGIEPSDINATVSNLGDLYWDWAKNQVHEHHNNIDGQFTGHECFTNPPAVAIDFTSTDVVDGFGVYQAGVDLFPLDSGWVEFNIMRTDPNEEAIVTVIDGSGVNASHYKVYSSADDGATETCQSVPDGMRNITPLLNGHGISVLVSNTDHTNLTQAKSFTVKLQIVDPDSR